MSVLERTLYGFNDLDPPDPPSSMLEAGPGGKVDHQSPRRAPAPPSTLKRGGQGGRRAKHSHSKSAVLQLFLPCTVLRQRCYSAPQKSEGGEGGWV